MTPCIAIIDRNTLSAIALRSILWETFSNVEIHLYNTMDRFIRDSNRHFIHFFVHSDILFRHIDEFVTLKNQTTVLHENMDSGRVRSAGNDLSPREQEVLILMVKGLINKEIAQRLNISLTTVIFHRNNICEKLQTRSIGRLTIFAVLSGMIDINDI